MSPWERAFGGKSAAQIDGKAVSTFPVGMKNPNRRRPSRHDEFHNRRSTPHTFIYRGWEVESSGNPLAHAILRGSLDTSGHYVSNYHYENLLELFDLYAENGLKNPSVIVDVNHANSGKKIHGANKNFQKRGESCNLNSDIRGLVKGLMIESYIADGAQKIGQHEYGKSITDPCLGWEKTEKLVLEIADSIK